MGFPVADELIDNPQVDPPLTRAPAGSAPAAGLGWNRWGKDPDLAWADPTHPPLALPVFIPPIHTEPSQSYPSSPLNLPDPTHPS